MCMLSFSCLVPFTTGVKITDLRLEHDDPFKEPDSVTNKHVGALALRWF